MNIVCPHAHSSLDLRQINEPRHSVKHFALFPKRENERKMLMSDKILRQTIVDELDFEPSIDFTNIGVAVENGV